VEEALDKRTQMGIVGDLGRYTQFQAANAMEDAANNPGGAAGEGLGLGMGIAAGQQMAAGLSGAGHPQQQYPQQQHPQQQYPQQPAAQPQQAPGGPPPLPAQDQWYLGAGGERHGPYDIAGLAAQAGSGALTGATLVWKAGMAQWTPAQQVPELAQILASTPPPLPPS
jgi:hypothetical protein